MLLGISYILAFVSAFVAGVLVQKKNDLVSRAQAGEQAALDAIKSKLNLK